MLLVWSNVAYVLPLCVSLLVYGDIYATLIITIITIVSVLYHGDQYKSCHAEPGKNLYNMPSSCYRLDVTMANIIPIYFAVTLALSDKPLLYKKQVTNWLFTMYLTVAMLFLSGVCNEYLICVVTVCSALYLIFKLMLRDSQTSLKTRILLILFAIFTGLCFLDVEHYESSHSMWHLCSAVLIVFLLHLTNQHVKQKIHHRTITQNDRQ